MLYSPQWERSDSVPLKMLRVSISLRMVPCGLRRGVAWEHMRLSLRLYVEDEIS